jgi:hypothetical protein
MYLQVNKKVLPSEGIRLKKEGGTNLADYNLVTPAPSGFTEEEKGINHSHVIT